MQHQPRPPYLSEHCIPVSSSSTCRTAFPAQHIRPSGVAGPMARNSLPDFIRDPTSSTDVLGVHLKRTCSCVTSASSALGVLNDYALYKSTHTLAHSLSHSKARTLPATPRPQHSRPKPRPPKVRTKPRPELCDLRPTPRPKITGQSNLTRGAPGVVQAILPLFLVFGIYGTQLFRKFHEVHPQGVAQ